MKLGAFKEIDAIDEQIASLHEQRKLLLNRIQSACNHPNSLKKAIDGGSYPDGWGGTEWHEPTMWECGMCSLVIKKDTK